ncbi:TetR/AcrR family transcriptional regulator [Rummeliibacillus sp. SL167]|uniref:TetR/AcrR family transcriptional regulator n=1 Tax=Rummeliibacillus sp. SL167 TaxID=2579792 RepID=UPI0011B45026|nr:TetR/AcrR family transcriptional regulator [Rummeliibacillus sp. SL167]
MGKIHEQMNSETKQKLENAFIKIMAVHGIQGVTVRALTNETGLNRGTFYLHYSDKFDLMEQIQERLLAGMKNCLKDVEPLEGLGFIENGQPYPPIIQMFTYFRKEVHAFKVLLGPTGDPSFAIKVKSIYKETILKKLLPHIPKESVQNFANEEVKKFQSYFLSFSASAIFGLIEEWLSNDAKETPEEMGIVQMNIIKMIRSQTGNMK